MQTDQHLFERILHNLISNAIRYTAEGRVLIGCRRQGKRLAVQVWDTGVGIPSQMQRQIFEEFQRLGNAPRRDGKGLGLSRLPNVLQQGSEPEFAGCHARRPARLCWCQVEHPLAGALSEVIDRGSLPVCGHIVFQRLPSLIHRIQLRPLPRQPDKFDA